MRYTIILDPDIEDGGYTVTVPALPGCITQGDTFDEAIANAHEAIRAHIGGYVKDGEPVPVEAPGLTIAHVDVDVPQPALALA